MKKYDLFEKGSDKIFTIMRICDFEEEEINDNMIPHLHDYYSIFWIDTGVALHATEFVEYTVKAGSILFVPPGLMHRTYLDNTTGGVNILFNEEFVQLNRKDRIPLKDYQLFNNSDFKTLINLDQRNSMKFKQVTDQIFEEIQHSDTFSQDIVLNLLHLFLLESRRIFNNQYDPEPILSEDTPDATLIRFKTLIEDNFMKNKSVSSYAEMLHISPSCLNEVSKRTTGITAGEMIRNKVIEETKKLLYSTNLTGKEIAYQLGFEDPSYFSRFFKKYTGTTLSDFRQFSRKKYH